MGLALQTNIVGFCCRKLLRGLFYIYFLLRCGEFHGIATSIEIRALPSSRMCTFLLIGIKTER